LDNKANLAQKVLVRAINECLRRGIFTLDPNDTELRNPILEFEIEGVPAIVGVHDAGHGELSLKVALWPTKIGREFANVAALNAGQRRRRGGFFTSAWLERKDGAWLQTSHELTVSCSNSHRADIEALSSEEPMGFKADGKFLM